MPGNDVGVFKQILRQSFATRMPILPNLPLHATRWA
jgi:hypothetical protein